MMALRLYAWIRGVVTWFAWRLRGLSGPRPLVFEVHGYDVEARHARTRDGRNALALFADQAGCDPLSEQLHPGEYVVVCRLHRGGVERELTLNAASTDVGYVVSATCGAESLGDVTQFSMQIEDWVAPFLHPQRGSRTLREIFGVGLGGTSSPPGPKVSPIAPGAAPLLWEPAQEASPSAEALLAPEAAPTAVAPSEATKLPAEAAAAADPPDADVTDVSADATDVSADADSGGAQAPLLPASPSPPPVWAQRRYAPTPYGGDIPRRRPAATRRLDSGWTYQQL